MRAPPTEAFSGIAVADLKRPEQPAKAEASDEVLFVRSFLITRTVVGMLGLVLSTVLVAGDMYLFKDKDKPRSSLSAYYYSEMGDVFVGALFVIGFMLLTYLSSRAKTWDFAISSFAGIMALGVALFPTAKEGMPAGTVAYIHGGCATLFMASLGVISIFFARETIERRSAARKEGGASAGRGLWLQLAVHCLCPVLMIVGGLVIVFRWRISDYAPLYAGEVLCVWAFSVSWLASGKDLLPGLGWLIPKRFRRRLRPPADAQPASQLTG